MLALQAMIDRQSKVNSATMGDEWYKMGLDWDTAIIVEISELIDSYPWKWWKNSEEVDIQNAKIELVDIWHFVLSKMIEDQVDPNDILENKLILLASEAGSNKCDMKKVVKFSKELLRQIVSGSKSIAIAEATMMLAGKVGISYEELAKIYFGKAVLNEFRQANGYKHGTYIKTWNGHEDNEVMMRLTSEMTYDDAFDEKLFMAMTEEYMTVA